MGVRKPVFVGLVDVAFIAVGSGKILDDGKVQPMQVKAGDRVLIGKYSGTEIKLEGAEHVIIREDEVLGVIS